MTEHNTAIWWVRRDLRLADNQALTAACQQAENVAPLFILDERLLNSPFASEKRAAFLFGSLRALDESLRQRGSRLAIFAGDPAEVLSRVVQATGATAIFAEQDISPFAQARDARVQRELPMLQLRPGLTALPLDLVRKADGTPYVVYSPFKRQWLAQPLPEKQDLLPAPSVINSDVDLDGQPIPASPIPIDDLTFAPGEDEAVRRLQSFVMGDQPTIYGYANNRDLPGVECTSQLSPFLRFGMVSARRAVVAARYAIRTAPTPEARKGAETWLSELIWRDFYISILNHFPQVRGSSFRPEYDQIQWRNDPAEFDAWCEGRTGYPFVDAAMRHLRTTGWMHNRARMVTASFLVKDLLVDWRWGERWFMQQLIDGDPAANNGGWQWVAGTGTDAAPYFRVFNPVTQSEKFDPQGSYIRRWVPELATVSDRHIHAPWQMTRRQQEEAGCLVGKDYPPPIVDHAFARERVLEAYAVVKQP
jgi:deoxyribodipyrimidine photo-lyase